MEGRIHSIETFGSVDGPGVRFVVFLQGCLMRCRYCHNPETWSGDAGEMMTAEEVFRRALRYRTYWGEKGGITVSGGEPLLQMEFLTELFSLAKRKGIHTCIDTCGAVFRPEDPAFMEKLNALLALTDLILLDIKHIDPQEHEKLCAHSNRPILAFARYLSEVGKPVWIRHVVVPGITQDERWLYETGRFIGTLKNVKALDVLPYHDMGKIKYEKLGLEYPLKDTPPLSKEDAVQARQVILSGIRASKIEQGKQ